ncbi:MAG: sigma-54 dependent transcriptional regulator [Salaquimonas sp.]
MQHTILIVDDEPVQRRLLEATAAKAGYSVLKAASGEEALKIFAENQGHISVIVLDLVMPGIGGMEVMQQLHNSADAPPVIVQTAQGGIETVVNAMREGAFDFVVKPVAPERLITTIEKAVKFKRVQKAPFDRKASSRTKFNFDHIITRSDTMRPIIAMGEKAATSTIPVLIEGESGVGKELIARAIHGSSQRADKPLITVNCGALPENIVESILFGHEKGAFTGASEKHIGKFEEANGGTLFLDEIGELPLDLQVKMLRAIQEGEIDPVGASRSIRVDVRLVSATNRNLLNEVKAGRFREDLYYRLNVLPMTIPPLRNRPSDIEPLVFHFVKKIAREQNKPSISSIRPDVIKSLAQYDWPGNIRELENAIFRAIVLCEDEELTLQEFPQITSQLPDFDLPQQVNSPEPIRIDAQLTPSLTTPEQNEFPLKDAQAGNFQRGLQPKSESSDRSSATSNYGMISMISSEGQIKTLEEMEGEAIQFAMEIYNNRMSEIARRLGIGRSTLYRKMKEHELSEE